MSDVTISGCKDPVERLKTLNEWRQHIVESIAEKKDRQYVIEHEIAEWQREILKEKGFEHIETMIWKTARKTE